MEQVITEENKTKELEAKQFQKMTQTSIPRLIIGLGIPTTLSMMVTSLYNLADTYFVSLIGNDAVTAAVSNLLALMSIIQAIGFTFGMGSGSIISRLLGKHDKDGADEVASSSFFIACVSGLVILLIGFIFLTPLMQLFGSRADDVLDYSCQYARFILISAPFMCMSFVLNNVLRAEGKAVLSMVGLLVGALVNVVLDPILIFACNLGITGAAVATCVSQIISFCVLFGMFLSGKTIIRIRLRSISRKFAVYGDVIATGLPSFWRQILASLCTVFLNGAAFDYGVLHYGVEEGGKAAQASFGVVQKIFMLAFSVSLGIGQGYQPVLGYNYASKRFDRVKKAYVFTLVFSMVLMTVFATACAIFAPAVMQMFSLSEWATEIGTLTLRLQCIGMPLLPLNFMASITYQAVGSKLAANVLSVSRQGLFYIPSVLILPSVFQLFGVQCAQTVSDVFSFLFAIPFTVGFFRSLNKQAKENEERKAAGIAYDEAEAVTITKENFE